jgi:hypothetical protein
VLLDDLNPIRLRPFGDRYVEFLALLVSFQSLGDVYGFERCDWPLHGVSLMPLGSLHNDYAYYGGDGGVLCGVVDGALGSDLVEGC